MKTIQAVARYFPDNCGGIQININKLVPKLLSHGVEISIAAAQLGTREENSYICNGIEVYRYPVFSQFQPEIKDKQIVHGGFEYFAKWLKNQQADIYHQHHWEGHCGLPHLRLAKELGMATAVTIHYIANRQQNLQEMVQATDRIIVVCEWLYKALLFNGIPEDKLILCRCGISEDLYQKIPPVPQQKKSLKVCFLGRWDKIKGIHILVQAIKNLPIEFPIELFIHGIQEDEQYRQDIITLIGNEQRIHIAKQLTQSEIPRVLTNYDLMAVPSQWMETGPLVVLEAHALLLPVLGSNLGGIAELVKHEINGLLVPHDDIKAWTKALTRLTNNANLLERLRQGIQPVRSVSMQATELTRIYKTLLTK